MPTDLLAPAASAPRDLLAGAAPPRATPPRDLLASAPPLPTPQAPGATSLAFQPPGQSPLWSQQANREVLMTPGLDKGGQQAVYAKWQGRAFPVLPTPGPMPGPALQAVNAFGKAPAQQAASVIGTVAPEYAQRRQQDLEHAYPSEPSAVNTVAGGLGSTILAVPALVAGGPAALAGLGAATGVGAGREEAARRRAAGEDVSGLEEAGMAASRGAINAGAMYAGGRFAAGPAASLVENVGASTAARVGTAVGADVAAQAGLGAGQKLAENAADRAVLSQGEHALPGYTEGAGSAALAGGAAGLGFAPVTMQHAGAPRAPEATPTPAESPAEAPAPRQSPDAVAAVRESRLRDLLAERQQRQQFRQTARRNPVTMAVEEALDATENAPPQNEARTEPEQAPTPQRSSGEPRDLLAEKPLEYDGPGYSTLMEDQRAAAEERQMLQSRDARREELSKLSPRELAQMVKRTGRKIGSKPDNVETLITHEFTGRPAKARTVEQMTQAIAEDKGPELVGVDADTLALGSPVYAVDAAGKVIGKGTYNGAALGDNVFINDGRRGFAAARSSLRVEKSAEPSPPVEPRPQEPQPGEAHQAAEHPQVRPEPVEQAAQGESVAAPAGWKLHLATDDPEAVSRWLTENGLTHKVGRSGGQEGKDVTVYVGGRDAANDAAAKISGELGAKLRAPSGDTLADDTALAPNVMGRFDVGRGDTEFHQYGSQGVPHLMTDVQNKTFGANVPPEQARARADAALRKKYGEFYAGKPEAKPQAAQGREIVPAAARGSDMPTLTRASRAGSTIYLSFDGTSGTPEPQALQEQLRAKGFRAEVIQFKTNIISGAQGNVNYRVDVEPDAHGRATDRAGEMYRTMFGHDEPITNPSEFERAAPLGQRFEAARQAGIAAEIGRLPRESVSDADETGLPPVPDDPFEGLESTTIAPVGESAGAGRTPPPTETPQRPSGTYFHSGKPGLTEFQSPKDVGAHFGTREQARNRYTGGAGPFSADLYEAELDIKNPLRVPDYTGFADLRRKLPAKYRQYKTPVALREALKAEGYDGLVYENKAEGAGDSYVPFDPSQVQPKTINSKPIEPPKSFDQPAPAQSGGPPRRRSLDREQQLDRIFERLKDPNLNRRFRGWLERSASELMTDEEAGAAPDTADFNIDELSMKDLRELAPRYGVDPDQPRQKILAEMQQVERARGEPLTQEDAYTQKGPTPDAAQPLRDDAPDRPGQARGQTMPDDQPGRPQAPAAQGAAEEGQAQGAGDEVAQHLSDVFGVDVESPPSGPAGKRTAQQVFEEGMAELRARKPQQQAAPPKPKRQTKHERNMETLRGMGLVENIDLPETRPATPSHDAALRADIARLQARKFKTAADETAIFLKQGELHADPSKWQPGQGVAYYAGSASKSRRGSQVNRGFRVVSVDPQTKQATIRQVADTGLTSTGGNYDRVGEQQVHVADLMRDKKYDAPVKEFNPRSPSPSAGNGDATRAQRFRQMADGLTQQIEDKHRESTQNPTPKRMRQERQRRTEGDVMLRTQRALRALADAHEAGTVPAEMRDVKSKAEVADLVRKKLKHNGGYYDAYYETDEYQDQTPAGRAMQALLENKTPEQRQTDEQRAKANKIRELEDKVRFQDIPGFFPTPRPVIDRMMAAADVKPGMKVLEPSAGKGDIADALREKGVEPDTVEYSPPLEAILKAKGHNVVGDDFLKHQGKYDRIVMNPPFEKGQDIEHVRHAYDLLNPGGRIVAVMSEGPFGRSDRKATEFREWLKPIGTSEKLGEGSFSGAGSFRQTGVATRLVVINKGRMPTDVRRRGMIDSSLLAAGAGAAQQAAGETAGRLTHFYSEPFINQMRRLGGAAGEKYAGAAMRMMSKAKETYGRDIAAIDAGREAVRKLGAASTWLRGVTDEHFGVGVRRVVNATEGDLADVPEPYRPAVQTFRAANLAIGKKAEGVVPDFKATGRFQRNLTEYGMSLMARPWSSPVKQRFLKWVMGKNHLSEPAARDIFDTLADQAAKGDFEAVTRRINQEYKRQLRYFPTSIRDGGWQDITHATPDAYLARANRATSSRVAWLSEFGATPEKAQAARAEIRAAGGDVAAFDRMAKAMHEMPTDFSLTQRIAPAGTLTRKFLNAANEGVADLKALFLTGAAPANATELAIGSVPQALGFRAAARGWVRLIKGGQRYRGAMESQGMIDRAMYDWAFDPTQPVRSVNRMLRNLISEGSFNRFVNELNEQHAAATADAVSVLAQSGKLGEGQKAKLQSVARAMGFADEQARALAEGKAPVADYDAFVRRAPAFLSGGNRIGLEASAFQSSRTAQELFPYQSYGVKQLNQGGQYAENFARALKSGDRSQALASARLLGRWTLGTTAQGAAQGLFYAMLGGAMGVGIWKAQNKDEPVKFVTDSFLNGLSGPFGMIYRFATGGAAGKGPATALFPVSLAGEVGDLFEGRGIYRDQSPVERVGTFARQRVGGGRILWSMLSTWALGENGKDTDTATKAYWRWRHDNGPPVESAPEGDTLPPEQREFRVQMRRAYRAMVAGEDPQPFIRSALAMKEKQPSERAAGDRMAESIRGRLLLEPLKSDERDALRRHVGDAAYQRLAAWDDLLEQWAASVPYESEHNQGVQARHGAGLLEQKKTAGEVEKAYRPAKEAMDAGDVATARTLVDANRDTLLKKPDSDVRQNYLADVRKAMRRVEQNPNLTAQQKREQLQRLDELIGRATGAAATPP